MYTCRGRPAKGNQAAQGLITAAALCAVDQDLFNPVSRMCKMENRIAFGAMALQVFAPTHAHARTRTHTHAHTRTHTHAQIRTHVPSRALPIASFLCAHALSLCAFPFVPSRACSPCACSPCCSTFLSVTFFSKKERLCLSLSVDTFD